MRQYFYTLLFLLSSISVFAASIRGTVVDQNNVPLTGVVVSIPATGKGTVSDIDGKYEISGLAPGTYEIVFSYATYKTYKENIVIAGTQDVILDMKMLPESTELKDQVVRSVRITNTENAVISEIRNSNTIVNGTSAAQISKTLDRNAADVAKRIPGVTIQDDRFIVIRGLPDRYNNVWLNDASTPSSEADKKSFSFDIIPAGLIDRLLIYKAPSPELPGDFAGGMVKVYSTCLTDKNQVIVNLSTSSREFTTGSNFHYNPPSSTDWLGYDDGRRNIPSIIPGRIKSSDPNYKANIGAWSKSFGNDWIVNTKTATPDVRFSAAMSNIWKFKRWKLGNTAGVIYSNTSLNTRTHRQDFDSVAQKYNFSDMRSVNTVNTGFMENVGFSMGNTKIEFRNLYSQIGASSLTIRSAIRDTGVDTHPDERAYSIGYDSKATYAAQLSGSHHNRNDTRKYNWTLGYTDLFKNQPNLRRLRYNRQWTGSGIDTVFKAQVAGQVDILNGGGRLYLTLYEHTYSFNHQFTQAIKVNNDFSFDVSVGNYVEYKSRSFKIRELGYTLNQTSQYKSMLYLPINDIFNDTGVDGNKKFKIGENTQPFDHYDAQNQLIASFVNFKVPLGKRLVICGGARYEYNMQSLKAVLNTDTTTSDVKTKFLLPSVNASYTFNEKSLVRIAYGKTVNRPEFREWSTLFFYDFDDIAGTYGAMFPTEYSRNAPVLKGDTLKVATIQNFDARYEFYPSMGEMISVGGFYKAFRNPILRAVLNSSDNKSFTFINADDGYCYGLELDIRKNLSWFDTLFHTKIFSDLTFVSNLTLTRSQINIDTSRAGMEQITPKSNLQGQSPYIVNLGLYYQNPDKGFQGSVLYNVFGARMYAIGKTVSGGESIGEMPVQTLDATVSKLFFRHYILTVGVQNLLNSMISYKLDANRDGKYDPKSDREYRTYNLGRYYSIGIKVRF